MSNLFRKSPLFDVIEMAHVHRCRVCGGLFACTGKACAIEEGHAVCLSPACIAGVDAPRELGECPNCDGEGTTRKDGSTCSVCHGSGWLDLRA